MASNTLPASLDNLITLAEDMADGLHAHEVAVGIKQNLEAVVRPAITALTGTKMDSETAQAAKQTLTTAVTVADSNGKAFIGIARDVLAPSLGSQWSVAWEPVGFPNQSLAIPGTQASGRRCSTR